jgi:class 3 adenylate cyclase/tetratricopeptide (TPR) repeat protein
VPDARFCHSCGHRVEAPADLRALTPPHLVQRILRERSGLEGERRVVTVLFADAAGSVAAGESLDAEELYGRTQSCVQKMLDAVHRYEGTVTQFRGDGIMALFGAPLAHEDAARRAVAAALDMQRALQEAPFTYRVGLNTGSVVVGRIGDDLVMDYTALGDTVNLAARLESAADPGAIYISDFTYRAVGDFFECEPVGELHVKGKAEPVLAYRALCEKGVRTRFEAAATRELTPFVGRAEELAILRSHVAQVRAGRGRVVAVSGEAGIGKSRLLFELRRSLDDVRWLEGHCISYGRSIAYLPIIDLVKRCFGIEEADSEDGVIAKVESAAAGWTPDARATTPYLRFLLSVDPGDQSVATMDPQVRRAGILDALRTLVAQESQREPLVIVAEDLHWTDEPSQDAIRALADVVTGAPVLLVVTFRPGYTHALAESVSRIALGNLLPDETAAMAAGVLQAGALPAELSTLIASKAEGNPFYVEEVTKTLVETGVLAPTNGRYTLQHPLSDVKVPDTIQEVILARIDRLEPEAKQAIQLASVIGREFTVRLLDRISGLEARLDSALAELKSLELIYEKTFFPELAYMFKHALTHDVAYSTLLVERRKALHRVVAAAVEELYEDRLAEQYETVAYHYERGEVWPKALDYMEKAGDKAAASFANEEALDYYAKAIALCERLDEHERAIPLNHRRGVLAQTVGNLEASWAAFEQMRVVAREQGDAVNEALALCSRALTEWWQHEFETAQETSRAALAIAPGGEGDLRFLAMSILTLATSTPLDVAAIRYIAAELESLVPTVQDPSATALWHAFKACILEWDGLFGQAADYIRRHGTRIVEAGPVFERCFVRFFEGKALAGAGRYEAALELFHEDLAWCRRIGEVFFQSRILNTIGWIHAELEDHEGAMPWNEASITAAIELGAPDFEVEGNARINLGDNLMALGRMDEAEEQFRIVEGVYRDPKPAERWALLRYSQHLLHSSGELWLARGDAQRALAYADECIEIAERNEARKNIVKGRRLRGQALAALGQPGGAEQDLGVAVELARQIGNPTQLWKSLAASGAYAEAMAVIDAIAAGLSDERLRNAFLGSEAVRRVAVCTST